MDAKQAAEAGHSEEGRLLPLEAGTPLSFKFHDEPRRYRGVLLGMIQGEAVILGRLQGIGIKEKLYPGNTLLVQYVVGGLIYAFQTRVLRYLPSPVPLLLGTYPEILESQTLRKQRRVACRMPVQGQIDGEPFEGVVMDLSVSGCSLAFRPGPKGQNPSSFSGRPVELRFELLGMAHELAFRGAIRNMTGDERLGVIGVSFEDPDPEFTGKISEYLDRVVALVD